jgi:hypothetical protein
MVGVERRKLTFRHGKLPVAHYTTTVYTYQKQHLLKTLLQHTNNTAVKAGLPNVFIPSNVNKLIP